MKVAVSRLCLAVHKIPVCLLSIFVLFAPFMCIFITIVLKIRVNELSSLEKVLGSPDMIPVSIYDVGCFPPGCLGWNFDSDSFTS